MNTNSAAEFGNKVKSCVTEDAKIFYCYIGWNLYVEDRVEYFSVFLVAAISATVPASIIFFNKIHFKREFIGATSVLQPLLVSNFIHHRLRKSRLLLGLSIIVRSYF